VSNMAKKLTLRVIEKAMKLYELMDENVYYSRRKLGELIGLKNRHSVYPVLNFLLSQGKVERVYLKIPGRQFPLIVYRKRI